MKKNVLMVAMTTILLVACSSDNTGKQVANDHFQEKSESLLPSLKPLATGGINLPTQDPAYQLPTINIKKSAVVDIRPPVTPLAIIKNSVAQFDGERAFIAYPVEKKQVYGVAQVERLLKEKNISFKKQGNQILTDWISTNRLDDIGDLKVRYQIEQIVNEQVSALVVLILEMKKNDVIFTPSVSDKRRYVSDELNVLIGELNKEYEKQKGMLLEGRSIGAIDSQIVTDINKNTALMLIASFDKSWTKLGEVLPKLGFDIEKETVGRGNRELKYSELDNDDWLRISTEKPELDSGSYFMQLNAVGKRSNLVIFNEDGEALSGKQAEIIYQALHNILAR